MDNGSTKAKGKFRFENNCHKQNFIITLCVYFNFVLLGWTYGQLGTAFVDLQQILDTNVQQTSLIFTMNSIGYMLGSLLIGVLYDRFDKLKLLGIITIVNGVTSAVLPWCSRFGLFLFVRLVDGFLCGGRDGGGIARVSACWGFAGRPYMQALGFTYAFGGIISPIVTSLYLAPRIVLSNQTSYGLFANETQKYTLPPSMTQHVIYNKSMFGERNMFSSTPNATEKGETFNNSNIVQDDTIVYGESKIHIAFVITGLLTALSGCMFLILYCLGYEHVLSFRPTVATAHQEVTKDQPISHPRRATLSKSQTEGGLAVPYATWIMVPLAGFAMAPIFITFIVWTQEIAMDISGKMGGFFIVSGALGFFIDPLFIGYLMENKSPLYFIHINVLQCLLCLGIMLLIIFQISKIRSIQKMNVIV
ncbi:uncharacterized protein LOC128210564 [Mya arenaria]|uniref:uncharacterized protein LOC128210564 n=1 Tax=Mya arenaria TaxID=6604 RepID=UPI0022E8F096|nr:uncharacterized protein LOC128210564 [Mya arenaria]